MSNRLYTPDRWVIVKIQAEGQGPYYRVFAGWYGGFTQGDSWKLSSGIEKSVDKGDYYEFYNTSGSIYKCWKGEKDGVRTGDLGMSGYMMSIYNSYREQCEAEKVSFEAIDYIPLLEKPDEASQS